MQNQLRNFKLILEYDGSAFSGWQTQIKGLRTIQHELEQALFRIFKTKINCQASGRTDTGVHALGQVAHFKVTTNKTPELIQRALNAFLEKDIRIVELTEVDLNFHAQRSARSKTYCYTILNRKQPTALFRNTCLFYPTPLNTTAMRLAAKEIIGEHDFKTFQAAAQATNMTNTIRHVYRLTINKEGDFIRITITANGFLQKMVRNIVGTLLAVGTGKLTATDVRNLMAKKDRLLLPPTIPANGLCLMSVDY